MIGVATGSGAAAGTAMSLVKKRRIDLGVGGVWRKAVQRTVREVIGTAASEDGRGRRGARGERRGCGVSGGAYDAAMGRRLRLFSRDCTPQKWDLLAR